MNERAMMRRKIQALQFAVWELHLFLDSHPNNCEAAKKLEEYSKQIQQLTMEYEKKYGPLFESSRNTSRWQWVSGPWPWELEEDED